MSRSAAVLGASGLVGSECLKILIAEESYMRIHALVRRPLATNHPKLTEQRVFFDRLPDRDPSWSSDAVFCCLGTTIGKAGSQEAFRQVDYHYVLEAARRAAENKAGTFLLVSALGADPRSRIFYNRVKGETERDLTALGLNRVVILRPSLILGKRKEHRVKEHIASAALKPMAGLMVGPLRRYRPVKASEIARAMVRMSLRAEPGVTTLESDEIHEMGKE